jgi:hypothetical protein
LVLDTSDSSYRFLVRASALPPAVSVHLTSHIIYIAGILRYNIMNRWTRVIAALGGLVLALGLGQVMFVISEGGGFFEALVYGFLIGVPGIVLLYGSYRLPRLN